jgi:hypothetical protein
MEVLIQLEGRRINVEISKMMVAEDVITTEEVLVVVVWWRKKFCSRREGSSPREGSGGGRSTETQVQRRWIGGRSSAQEKEFWRKFSSEVLQTELKTF